MLIIPGIGLINTFIIFCLIYLKTRNSPCTAEDKPIFLSIGYSACHWWQSGYCNHQ
ncbi:MAG: DUF255 domain-containing protein [Clostridiales bacterium]|nr:DUF255 domain-containing protein [Clostridiales bacterium]